MSVTRLFKGSQSPGMTGARGKYVFVWFTLAALSPWVRAGCPEAYARIDLSLLQIQEPAEGRRGAPRPGPVSTASRIRYMANPFNWPTLLSARRLGLGVDQAIQLGPRWVDRLQNIMRVLRNHRSRDELTVMERQVLDRVLSRPDLRHWRDLERIETAELLAAIADTWVFSPPPARLEPNWFVSQNTPILVRAADGTLHPLTYSHDTEFFPGDLFRILLRNPEQLALFEQIMTRRFPVPELAQELGFTEEQFRRLVIRPGIDRTQATVRATDIDPQFFDVLYRGHAESAQYGDLLRMRAANVLEQEGRSVSHHLDLSSHEINHSSYEDTPTEFLTELAGVQRDTRQPRTHLHLGIPANAISTEQFIAIARAVESLLVFDLAVLPTELRSSLRLNVGTSLTQSSGLTMGQRGIVTVHERRWERPAPTHDLEIRVPITQQNGRRLLGIAAFLAANHNRLTILPEALPLNIGTQDSYAGNLRGALQYVSRLLALDPTPRNRQISMSLLAFSDRLGGRGPYVRATPALRREIRDFLQAERVAELLTPELFLRRE